MNLNRVIVGNVEWEANKLGGVDKLVDARLSG
jgi:hypothetical protein